MKTVSVIIPLLDEEKIVDELARQLVATADDLPDYQFELILVDDGSRDETLNKLVDWAGRDSRFKILKLSRNWGHQNAYNAGLDFAQGDAVVFMDGDLEDPPSLIKTFLEKWEEGFEVVYTIKESRERSLWDRILFAMFYKLLRFFSEVNIEETSGMFSLVDRKVADHMRRCRERHKYYVGLRSFVGFRQTGIRYHRDKRFAGSPKQTFRRLANYALNAFFSFSFLPIRLLTYFGLILLALILLVSMVLIFGKLTDLSWSFFEALRDLPGWTSLVMLNLFLLGTQIIFIGVLGEYIARIFDEVRNRPYYIVETVFKSDKAGNMQIDSPAAPPQSH